jgi:serine/threonine protein kinase
VRLVKHKANGKYYALKVLKKHEVIRLKQVEHIMSEKSILAQVNHPFIVRLYVATPLPCQADLAWLREGTDCVTSGV